MRPAVMVMLVLMAGPARAFQSLPSDLRMNGSRVLAAFEPLREVLQQSSAVIYEGRREIIYGTVVSADGLIVTKASEIDGVSELVVRVGTRKFEKVERLGCDDRWDLALLRIEADDLVPVTWSQSGDPAQGTWVVTNGATSRSRRRALVGIISANPRGIEDREAAALGVVLDADASQLKVSEVVENGGAAAAGMRPDDVIVSIDGEKLEVREQLLEKLTERRSGEKVRVGVLRDGTEIELEVELTARSALFDDPMSRNDMMSGKFSERRSGFPRVLQHDILGASNSVGGPLLNLSGECVGVNIARANRAESFAIPAKEAREAIEGLKAAAGG